MAKRTPKRKKAPTGPQDESALFDATFDPFKKRVLEMSSSKAKTLTWAGAIIAAILIAASSVMYAMGIAGSWIPALIGTPAGLIIFFIGLGAVYRTRIGDWSIFQWRETLSFKQRLRRVGLGVLLYALIFIPLGTYIPYGLGGSILICLTLTALVTLRRTPEEIALSVAGLPDPRDFPDDDDAYAEPEEPDTDTDYYRNEEDGTISGRLD